MDKDQRRAQGAHYTTEKNILKVIEPLFLDELRDEFRRLQARRDSRRIPELIAFQQRLGQLRFFDPACGCGNFLIIAYRELRALEIIYRVWDITGVLKKKRLNAVKRPTAPHRQSVPRQLAVTDPLRHDRIVA